MVVEFMLFILCEVLVEFVCSLCGRRGVCVVCGGEADKISISRVFSLFKEPSHSIHLAARSPFLYLS